MKENNSGSKPPILRMAHKGSMLKVAVVHLK